jgi:hypothetical protein
LCFIAKQSTSHGSNEYFRGRSQARPGRNGPIECDRSVPLAVRLRGNSPPQKQTLGAGLHEEVGASASLAVGASVVNC